MLKNDQKEILKKLDDLMCLVSKNNSLLERIANKIEPADTATASKEWDEAIARDNG